MRYSLALALIYLAFGSLAQRDLTPTSRKQAFGKRDLRALSNYGLQVQVGATYLMTRLHNPTNEILTTSGSIRGTYLHDPKGQLGAYAEIGMFHFPKKRSKLSLALKTVLVSYYDWGVGFKYFRGMQTIETQLTDASGNKIGSPDIVPYRFEFGHVYGRFSLHKNINFKSKKTGENSNFFLDNSLGINVDYRVTTKTDPYPISTDPIPVGYSSPLHAQLHYGLGFGFRLKRGAYLIPGVRAPLVGFQMTQPLPSNTVSGVSTFGNPSFRWFSSRYWPALIHVKYMFAFEKKVKKGCPPVETNDQDKNTYKGK